MAPSHSPPPSPSSISASNQLRLRPHSPSLPSSPTTNFLDRLTTTLNHSFHSLGLLLSTHQIPSLLLCTLLICSLLAPSLTSFLTSTTRTTPTFSSRTSLQPTWNAPGLQRQGLIPSQDQVCWERLRQYYQLRQVHPTVIKVEQVLISTSARGRSRGRGGAGVLNKETLHRAWLIQNELERRLLHGEISGLSCVKEGAGQCAVASPLRWWKDEQTLLRDGDVHATLSLPPPIGTREAETGRIPLTSSSTLVGIGRDRQGLVKGAHHLAITFYLLSTATPVNTSAAHFGVGGLGFDWNESMRMKQNWRKAVREVVDGNGWDDEQQREKMGKVTEARGKGQRVILKHLPHLEPVPHPRALESTLFLLGYLLVLLYIARNLSHLGPHVVNSMPGLLLTGIVQLSLSGIMTLSVVGLLGWDTSLVPWNLMAFLVLVCGVDNMLVLTHAISLTDIRLPIPQRLAAGLQAVGLSSTVTLLAELVAAGTLLLIIDVQVIRQIIIFAAVVLVVDYFLEMTFFATILSIDIQRLELADLLTQGHLTQHQRHLPSTPSDLDDGELLEYEMDGTTSTTSQHFFSILKTTKSVFRDRAARTTTFGMLFLIDSLLYLAYGPDHFLPAFCSETALSPHNRPFLSPSLSSEIYRSLQRGQHSSPSSSTTTIYPAEQILPRAAAQFWQLLNPTNSSSAVHLQVEPVTAIQLFEMETTLAAPESLLLDATGAGGGGGGIVEPTWWSRMGMILLPIAGTIAILYVLLLYLLKDAELLQGERARKEKLREERRKLRLGARVEGVKLHGSWKGDVELLASATEAVVSWAGLEDRVVLWRRRKAITTTTTTTTGTTNFDPPIPLEIPLAADPPSLTLLAIDPTGRFCAAATTAGRILIWSLERQLLIDFSPTGEGEEEERTRFKLGRPVALFAGPEGEKVGLVGPPINLRGGGGAGSRREEARFCSVHSSGIVVLWDCVACTSTIVFRPSPTTVFSPPSPNSTPPLPPPAPLTPVPSIRTSIIIPSPHLLTGSTPSWPIYARHASDGRVTLYRADPAAPHQLWTPIFEEQVTTEGDPITALACGEVELGEAGGSTGSRGILVVGTLQGIVSIYSLPLSNDSLLESASTPPSPSTRLTTLAELCSPIRQLRLAPTIRRTSSPSSTPSSTTTTSEQCPTCAQFLHEGFLVIISSKESLQSLRVSLGGGGGASGGVGTGKGCMCSLRGVGGGGTRQRSESLGLGLGVARTTPKKVRRASHGRVTNGGTWGEEMSGNFSEGGTRRERGLSDGSQTTPSKTPLRTPATPATPTFKIDRPDSLEDDTSSSFPLDEIPLPSSTDIFSVPLFDTSTSDDSFLPSALPSSAADQFQVHELFNTYTDERGGWELVGDRIVGVRRAKRGNSLLAETNSGIGGGRVPGRWEVWSVELTMGAVIGQSELGNLLQMAPTVGSTTALADPSLDDPTSSSLRRRHQISTTPSSRRLLEPPSGSSSPSIRFQPTPDLPFSRARPLVAALDSSAIAVGLGNQLVLFSLRQAAGRAGGMLAMPRGRGMRERKKGQ